MIVAVLFTTTFLLCVPPSIRSMVLQEAFRSQKKKPPPKKKVIRFPIDV
jgi:hypothetical protein